MAGIKDDELAKVPKKSMLGRFSPLGITESGSGVTYSQVPTLQKRIDRGENPIAATGRRIMDMFTSRDGLNVNLTDEAKARGFTAGVQDSMTDNLSSVGPIKVDTAAVQQANAAALKPATPAPTMKVDPNAATAGPPVPDDLGKTTDPNAATAGPPAPAPTTNPEGVDVKEALKQLGLSTSTTAPAPATAPAQTYTKDSYNAYEGETQADRAARIGREYDSTKSLGQRLADVQSNNRTWDLNPALQLKVAEDDMAAANARNKELLDLEGKKAVAGSNLEGTKYTADTGLTGAKVKSAADILTNAATVSQSGKNRALDLEGTKYTADQSLKAHEANARATLAAATAKGGVGDDKLTVDIANNLSKIEDEVAKDPMIPVDKRKEAVLLRRDQYLKDLLKNSEPKTKDKDKDKDKA